MRIAAVPAAQRPSVVVGAASLWMAGLGNLPLWRELDALGLLQARSGWLLAAALAGILAVTLHALLSLAAWRPALKGAIAVLLLATTLGAHFMWSYHVVIDTTMAANTLQTDWHEVRALLTPRLAAALLLGAAAPAWLLWRTPVRYAPWRRQAGRNLAAAALALVAAAALLVASFQPLASTMRSHKHLRYLMNPLNSVYALAHTALASRKVAGRLAPLGTDAALLASAPRPPLLLLVVGETGRSGNWGLNGYPRDTTPELAREQVASFRNAWSCGTNTAVSVPCMFSHLGRAGYAARDHESENLLDVVRHAGLAVLWLDNQPGGCKGVCDRVSSVNTSAAADPALCPAGGCFDGVLLAGLDARIAALPPQQRSRGVVLVLHQMGSHGPAYSERSPPAFKRFQPECTSSHLPDCSPEALRNTYDNSIAYTDHVVASAIHWLRGRDDFDTALLYVADHGESLGEHNVYLHGLPYALAPDAQKHVPWITWISPAFERRTGLRVACLRDRADMEVSHDHLFHSVLGLLQVSTSAYRQERDAYAACMGH